jgi:hypothetical protein
VVHITVENNLAIKFTTGKTGLSSTATTAAASTSSLANTTASISSLGVSGSQAGLSQGGSLVTSQTTDTTIADYCGHIIYENGLLKYILNPEGYVTKNGNSYVFNYYLKNHHYKIIL